MLIRNYKNYTPKESAAIIVSEVIKYGKSNGWQGDLERLEEVEKICADYNVAYVDDWYGEWRLVTPKKD